METTAPPQRGDKRGDSWRRTFVLTTPETALDTVPALYMEGRTLLSGRWVCRSCFADNENFDDACAKCGTQRGVVPEGAPAWQPQPPARQPWWRGLTRYAFLILIAGGLAVGWVTSAKRDASGAVNQGGTLDVSDLRAGDCFDWKGDHSITCAAGAVDLSPLSSSVKGSRR